MPARPDQAHPYEELGLGLPLLRGAKEPLEGGARIGLHTEALQVPRAHRELRPLVSRLGRLQVPLEGQRVVRNDLFPDISIGDAPRADGA